MPYIPPRNETDYILDQDETESVADVTADVENSANYKSYEYTGPDDIGVPDETPSETPETQEDLAPTGDEVTEPYYTVYYRIRVPLDNYEPAYLQELAEGGATFYAIYDDDSEEVVDWHDITSLDPEGEIVDFSDAIASATNQHFWDDSNGAHVGEMTHEDWDTAVTNNFSDLSASKNYYNILLNSLGVLLRRALYTLVSISRGGIAFYDGLGNETTNIMSYFGRDSAQIGRENGKHLVINNDGITVYNGDGTIAPLNAANINAVQATINELIAGSVTTETLRAASAYIAALEAANVSASDISADKATIGSLVSGSVTTDTLRAASAYIAALEAASVSANDISADKATLGELVSGNVTATTLRAASAYIAALSAANISASDISTDHATIGSLSATYATIDNLDAATARIGSLETDNVSVKGRITAAEADVDNLQAATADIDTIRANSAKVANLTAAELEADHATIGSLDTNYAQVNLANVDNAWIENGIVKDGAITNAMINSVSANKLTAGTIDASNITVTNLNADNITTGTINGQRIGEGSLSLDKLSEDVYTEAEVDAKLSTMQSQIDGAIETWTGTAVPTLQNSPASSWNTTALKDSHVGDVYFVVNSDSQQNGYNYRFTKSGSTYSWQLIKDSDVTNALQRISTAEGKITIFDSDISQLKTDTGTLTTKTTSLETRMSDAEADILDKVDTTTFNEVSDTVDSHSQSITQMSTTLSNKADSSTVSAVTQRVSKNEQDISGINTTIGELQDTLETKADGSTVETVSNKLNTVSDTVDGHTQSISSITSTQTTMQGKLDKTLVETTQLWFSKANTTAPDKPTAQVTSTSTEGNAWRVVVPAYNASYPNYYYCYQWKYSDGTYGWSSVARDIAMGESQERARTAITNAANAQADIDGLEIGGRNLALNSETTFSNANYILHTYTPSDPKQFVTGDKYTISFEGALPEGKTNWYVNVYSDAHTAGYLALAYDLFVEKNGRWYATGTMPNLNGEDISNIGLYVSPLGAPSTAATVSHFKIEHGNRATDWTPAPEDVDADISTAQTSADNAQATANKNIKESQQLWFTKVNDSAPNKPTSKVTSTSTGANAWTTKVPTYNASSPYYFYCMQYVAADGTVTWSDVIYDRATTEAQSAARTTSANLTTLQQDYATFKQTTQNFESTIGSTYATKTEVKDAKDYVANAKTNYGYQYAKNIIVYGDSDKYYPVYFTCMSFPQTVTHDIMIMRSYNEQAPNDWNPSSSGHHGSLNLHFGWNFGGWGGATYKTEIYEFTEMYSTILGDILVGADNGMFSIVYLRGGGTTGALYHVYSDVPFTRHPYMANAGVVGENDVPYIGLEQGVKYAQSVAGDNPTYKWNVRAPLTEPNTTHLNELYTVGRTALIESRVSTAETSITQNKNDIALRAKSSDVYTKTQVDGKITQEVSDRNSAIEQSASAINLSVSQTYTTKTEFNNLEIGGRGTWYADWPRPVSAVELGYLSEKKYIEETGFIQDFSKKFCMRVDFMRSSSYQTQRYCLASAYGMISADTSHAYPELGIELQQNTGRLRIYSTSDTNGTFDIVVGTAPEIDIWSTALVWWDPETKEITWLLVSGDRSETGHYAPSGTYSRKSGLVRLGADSRVNNTWNQKYYQRDMPPIWYEEPPEDPKNLCRWSLIETAEGDPKNASPVECSSGNASIEEAKAAIKVTTDGISSTVEKIRGVKYLTSPSSGASLANIKTYSAEGTTDTWSVTPGTTSDLRVGDTIYLQYKDTTRNCYVYIKGTVNSFSNSNVNFTSHGYEDVLPVDTIISTIRQSAETVKIKASQVEIDGAAVFSNTAFRQAADAAYDAKGAAVTSESRIISRGEQLVINGNGFMGDNTNFTNLIFDGSMSNNSPGSFTRDVGRTNIFTDEMFPVDASKEYIAEFDVKSGPSGAGMYAMLMFYDVDKLNIDVRMVSYFPGSTTTLARELKNGDTVVYLTNASGWRDTSTAHQRSLIIWDYTNGFGYTYPAETYSRNFYNNSSGMWNQGSLNKSNNTITLRTAWTGGTHAAGTPISQNSSGSSYSYFWLITNQTSFPTEWAHISGIYNGIASCNPTPNSGTFWPGTAYCRIGWLWNYGHTSSAPQSQIWITNVSVKEYVASSSDAVKRTQRIYWRSTSNTKPSPYTTWLSTSGDGYGNWSLNVPQLTKGATKYPFLYTAVQSQTVSQQAAGSQCTCSAVTIDDSTTVIDGGSIITNSITANQIAAGSITANEIDASDLHVSAANVDGTLTASQIDASSLHVSAANIDGTITASQINANGLTIGYSQVTDTPTIPSKVSDLTNDISMAWQGTCTTASGTAAKVVTCAGFALVAGASITVRFSNNNTSAAALTLNVNSTGAKTIYINGGATAAANQLLWAANATISFTYDGTYWRVTSEPRSWYSTCSTAAATAAKTASIAEVVICKGTSVSLQMSYANAVANPTLNITSLGAKAIYTAGARPTATSVNNWTAASTVSFIFDGQYFRYDSDSSTKANAAETNAKAAIPTDVSELNNDAGYATTTQAQGYADAKDSAIAAAAKRTYVSIAVTAIDYDANTATLKATLFVDGSSVTDNVTYTWYIDGSKMLGYTDRTFSVTSTFGIGHVYSCTVTYT